MESITQEGFALQRVHVPIAKGIGHTPNPSPCVSVAPVHHLLYGRHGILLEDPKPLVPCQKQMEPFRQDALEGRYERANVLVYFV